MHPVLPALLALIEVLVGFVLKVVHNHVPRVQSLNEFRKGNLALLLCFLFQAFENIDQNVSI